MRNRDMRNRDMVRGVWSAESRYTEWSHDVIRGWANICLGSAVPIEPFVCGDRHLHLRIRCIPAAAARVGRRVICPSIRLQATVLRRPYPHPVGWLVGWSAGRAETRALTAGCMRHHSPALPFPSFSWSSGQFKGQLRAQKHMRRDSRVIVRAISPTTEDGLLPRQIETETDGLVLMDR